MINDRIDTPESVRGITPETTVRASLAKVVTISVIAAGAVAAVVSGYDHLNAKLDQHINDEHIHLRSDYHLAHGQPVGNFDFTTAIERLTNALSDVQKRPVLIGGACRKVSNGVLCDQKE
ncbi:MAG: hypothetical protein ABJA82_00530 [Myxococcales bacterium]